MQFQDVVVLNKVNGHYSVEELEKDIMSINSIVSIVCAMRCPMPDILHRTNFDASDSPGRIDERKPSLSPGELHDTSVHTICIQEALTVDLEKVIALERRASKCYLKVFTISSTSRAPAANNYSLVRGKIVHREVYGVLHLWTLVIVGNGLRGNKQGLGMTIFRLLSDLVVVHLHPASFDSLFFTWKMPELQPWVE
ncbi:hypothetical protein MLD38_005537 [Melastoma candidum]|uniref:Uncharacterized protein n=1 Tax=Melastoma candidum TaxID=119954 RepID=A0ACB9RJI9_9MYRT|nr:hypothetical protein MLD38_005537 [Melastoma candidum]